MKRLIGEIDEYLCKPAVNGQTVLRFFHRQFHKFFSQFRTKELYAISLEYVTGELQKKFPGRKIDIQNSLDEINPLVVSETPYIMGRLTSFDISYFDKLQNHLCDVKNILKRIESDQLHEYLSDVKVFNTMLQNSKRSKSSSLESIRRLLSRKSYFIESFR
jgi:hypothetical protein